MYYSNVCAIPNIQGPRNDLFLRGALIKRKMRISLFPKFLLNKSPILRGARAPLAPLGPRPLEISMKNSIEIGNVAYKK